MLHDTLPRNGKDLKPQGFCCLFNEPITGVRLLRFTEMACVMFNCLWEIATLLAY